MEVNEVDVHFQFVTERMISLAMDPKESKDLIIWNRILDRLLDAFNPSFPVIPFVNISRVAFALHSFQAKGKKDFSSFRDIVEDVLSFVNTIPDQGSFADDKETLEAVIFFKRFSINCTAFLICQYCIARKAEMRHFFFRASMHCVNGDPATPLGQPALPPPKVCSSPRAHVQPSSSLPGHPERA